MTLIRTLTAAVAVAALAAGCGDAGQAVVESRQTPRETVATLVRALEAERPNYQAVHACFVGETQGQRAYRTAMADLVRAAREVQQAAADSRNFSREEARQILGASGPSADTIRQFLEAEQEIDGDWATLRTATGEVLVFRQIEFAHGAEWLIVPEATTPRSENDAGLAAATAALERMTRALNDVARQIRENRITDLAEARRQIMERGLPS